MCFPIPTTLPSSKTTIWSASKIVLILWATINTVASFVSDFNALRSFASVLKSRAEKLSSNINISGSFAIALAIDNLCFCPPDTFEPPCAISESNLSSLSLIKSIDWAILAALIISSSEAYLLPYLKLESIVPENNIPFCGTYPIFSLKSWVDTSLILTPSTLIDPSVTSWNNGRVY